MTKLVKFFYKWLYWLTPWWYGLTQTLTRKKRYPQVKFFGTVDDISQELNYGAEWREDPWKGILDVQMSPRKFQRNLDEGRSAGDCDDHALYTATALLKSRLADKAFLGTVWYAKPDGSGQTGHVVCVFEVGGKTYWADYHKPRAFGGKWGWAEQVATKKGKVVHAVGKIEVRLRNSGEPKLCKKVETLVL